MEDSRLDPSPPTEAFDEVASEVHKLLETMKYEVNRLNSFNEKWPLAYISPSDLAEAGFFYLQSEDKVQCAFCEILMERWVEGQKPLREHMRRSPKCSFLMSGDGNVPIIHTKPKSPPVFHRTVAISNPYIVKYPRMADVRRRLASFADWPMLTLTPKQLAECGLYYSGIGDMVTCHFCGGSLGNWEIDDDPWIEHEKFFPTCAFLRLKRNSGDIPEKRKPHDSATSYSNSVHREVIRQACEIFPKSLVEKVVFERMSRAKRNDNFSSLQELCDEILKINVRESKSSIGTIEVTESTNQPPANSHVVSSQNVNETTRLKETKDALLCKVCMDREMETLFQPCCHLVACLKCSEELKDCPVCRETIISTIRTYLS